MFAINAGNWSGVRGFEALPKHQFMIESTNINSLADHYIWSTIKTLPATLPEPSSMDRGPRTRVTGTVSLSDLYVCKGVGVYIGCRLLRVGPWFWDWRRRWWVTLFKMDKKLCFCVLACCAEESARCIFTYGWA